MKNIVGQQTDRIQSNVLEYRLHGTVSTAADLCPLFSSPTASACWLLSSDVIYDVRSPSSAAQQEWCELQNENR